MDVLAQALNVVEQAEATTGRVALTLNLDEPGQRAAYAAAIAVLRINGIDIEGLLQPLGEAPAAGDDDAPASQAAATEASAEHEMLSEQDVQLRREYAAALSELTPNESRRTAVLEETFPRIRELLRDGANVEAIAQIQYRRWVEANLNRVRQD
jgi:hypothetical protein